MRVTAFLLACALIHGAFAPQAWAQVVSIGAFKAPVGGGPAATNLPTTENRFDPVVANLNVGLVGNFTNPFAPAPLPRDLGANAGAVAPKELAEVPDSSLTASDKAPTTDDILTAAKNVSPEAGPVKAGTRTGLIAAIIKGVRDAFVGKSVESLPTTQEDTVAVGNNAAHAPNLILKNGTHDSQTSTPSEPPAPSRPNGASAQAKRSITWFLGGLLIGQVGVEILGLAMPLLMREKFGGFKALAQIAIYASMASIAGQLSGGWIANKFGIKGTYVGATVLRLLSISAMVVFLMGPAAPIIAAVPLLAKLAVLLNQFSPMSVLTGFYAFNGFMSGLALTAQKSIPNAILGSDRATLERFSSLQQWLLEIIGVSGPKAGGFMIQAFGFTSAIAVYPVMLLLAVGMYVFGLRIPKDDGQEASRAAGKTSRVSALRAVFAPLAPMHNAISKTASAFFAAIAALIDRLVLKAYLGRWIDQLGGKGKLTDADEQTLLTRSTLGWTLAALFSSAGFLTMLLPGTTPAYAAMIVYGVAQVIAVQKLYSLLLSRAKVKAEAVKINAVAGAVFMATSTIALNLAGMLFDKAAGMTPFLIFNAALIPLGAAVYFLHRMIKRTAAAGSPEPSPRPKGGFGLLFKDPMMRWSFLTFIALNVINPLLYQIISQAFGLMVVGGSASAASGVASWITSLYSFGGLLGALYMWRESSLISGAKKPAPPAAATGK